MNEFVRIDAALADVIEKLNLVTDSPRLDAELLLARALDVPRSYLFAHPEAVRFTHQFADLLVADVDEGFDDEEAVSDLSREGIFMGSLGLLLVIEPCTVGPNHFVKWRERFREVWAAVEPTDDETEQRQTAQRHRELLTDGGVVESQRLAHRGGIIPPRHRE